MRWFIAISIVLCACDPSALDSGFMEYDGHDARPVVLPWDVVVDDTIDEELVDEAVAWWGDRTGLDPDALFIVDHDPLAFDDIASLPMAWRPGYVLIWGGYPEDTTPDDDREPLGQTNIQWGDDGVIHTTDVIISPSAMTSDRWYRATIIHELGHCLGLDDDVTSVELLSIMSEQIDPSYDLTDADRDRVIGLVQAVEPDD